MWIRSIPLLAGDLGRIRVFRDPELDFLPVECFAPWVERRYQRLPETEAQSIQIPVEGGVLEPEATGKVSEQFLSRDAGISQPPVEHPEANDRLRCPPTARREFKQSSRRLAKLLLERPQQRFSSIGQIQLRNDLTSEERELV
jgi:hypothetical protein